MKLYEEIPLFWEALLRLFYPGFCTSCKKSLSLEERDLCHFCYNQMKGLRYPPNKRHLDITLKHLDNAYALYPYESSLQGLLKDVKFYRKPWLLALFEEDLGLWATSLQSENSYDFLVPIPMTWFHRVKRRFNQAEILCKLIRKKTQLPIKRALSKKRFTAIQSLLPRKDRLTNIRGAYRVRLPRSLVGKSVLLVDDILTTGTTLEESAKVLKAAGARKVDALVVAYTRKKSL